jgi:hypothetical protein
MDYYSTLIFITLGCSLLLLLLSFYVKFFKGESPSAQKYPFLSSNNYDEIPRVVYQTWHTEELPPKMKETNDQFKKDNPEFEYILFNDAESREFIKTHFDRSVVKAYDSLKPGAFKSDLWRYCVLFINGGVYLDIKYAVNGDFRLIDLFNTEKYPLPMVVETSPLYVYTGLLVTPPRNPLYDICIRRIVENVENQFYGNSPMAPTGPELFGEIICDEDKKRAVLFYYDDYFLKKGEEENRAKYRKRGFIKDTRTDENVLCHYLDYRIEQHKYSNTEYWMNLWANKDIYYMKECWFSKTVSLLPLPLKNIIYDLLDGMKMEGECVKIDYKLTNILPSTK